MKALGRLVGLGLMALAVACSNGQVSGSSASRSAEPSVSSTAPGIAFTGRVTDAAEILDRKQEAALSARLEQLERATGHQMVVVTVPTLGGADVELFTKDLANKWGIGRKGYNDGVVLLVAPNERKVRIAVGYGLEDSLTTSLCKQIIDQQMLPHFREGDFPGGIEAGANALIDQLS